LLPIPTFACFPSCYHVAFCVTFVTTDKPFVEFKVEELEEEILAHNPIGNMVYHTIIKYHKLIE
jgi:hypothetical protein